MDTRLIRTGAIGSMLAIATAFASGCNTTRGIGEDVEATGEAVQDAAQDTEDKLKDRR
ncbi:MAG: entericidin A/B family lipoprotein [Gammaproteobacteria bacterium]|nr:entericidin A/B family lipoprotein [Gammaproteobacteria bacterium]